MKNPLGGEERAAHGRAELLLELACYEGPLDVLLELARRQKVDLRMISVLELAEQYLTFIRRVQRLDVQVAADYLVMAAWLAYLKSCLLLPQEEAEHATADELAALLAARLEKLDWMRRQGKRLLDRPRVGRDVFVRGCPEESVVRRQSVWRAGIADLLTAYARVRARDSYAPLHLERPPVVAVAEAQERLQVNLPHVREWSVLTEFLPEHWRTAPLVRSAIGSIFAGTLELARLGKVEPRQERAFAPLHVRRRPAPSELSPAMGVDTKAGRAAAA